MPPSRVSLPDTFSRVASSDRSRCRADRGKPGVSNRRTTDPSWASLPTDERGRHAGAERARVGATEEERQPSP